MIHDAVARGAALFNDGHHAECADIYMTAVRDMVEYGEELPEPAMMSLTAALAKAEGTSCPTSQSWSLRHGMDRAYVAMRSGH